MIYKVKVNDLPNLRWCLRQTGLTRIPVKYPEEALRVRTKIGHYHNRFLPTHIYFKGYCYNPPKGLHN